MGKTVDNTGCVAHPAEVPQSDALCPEFPEGLAQDRDIDYDFQRARDSRLLTAALQAGTQGRKKYHLRGGRSFVCGPRARDRGKLSQLAL